MYAARGEGWHPGAGVHAVSSLAEERRRREEQEVAERWLCGELPGSPRPALRKVRNVVRDLSDYEPSERMGPP